MSNTEAFGEIYHTRFACFRDQIGDGLDIILGDFVCVFTPGLRKILSLLFRSRARG